MVQTRHSEIQLELEAIFTRRPRQHVPTFELRLLLRRACRTVLGPKNTNYYYYCSKTGTLTTSLAKGPI